jgi:type II secretory ATPase GspE/PulE/Tfp pilus assembly ATPase PilB-like protein
VSLAGKQMDRRLWALGPENIFMQHRIVPVALSGKTLTIAMVDPEDVGAIKELREVMAGFTFRIVAVSGTDLQRYIAAGFGKKKAHRGGSVDAKERPTISFMDDDSAVQMTSEAGAGQVVQLANEIVATAMALGASDIHIEVEAKGVGVRYRVDGQLRARPDPIPVEMARPLASRFKLLGKMDITENRRPLDGRISVNVGKKIVDLRVSTIPAKLGEKIVIRILDAAANISSMKNIMPVDALRDVFMEMLARPHGLILVTGPTGSGKTTTLYTALSERKRPELNTVTVEDPIEYHLDGVTQVQANAEIGTTFERLLRAILRQDPDIIMVGETRDKETAKIAVEASMTGHLVLTSVHTNSAIDAITRLIDLGVERHSIATGLMGVVHQRLVRRLCAGCKEPFEYPRPIVQRLIAAGALQEGDGTVLMRGVGCQVCNGTGFKGRAGIYELLVVNEHLKHAIASGLDPAGMREVAVARDALFNMARYTAVLLARGDTSPTEVIHLAEEGVSSEAFGDGEGAQAGWSSAAAPAVSVPAPRVSGAPGLPGGPMTAHFGVQPNMGVPQVTGAPLGPAMTAQFTPISVVPQSAGPVAAAPMTISGHPSPVPQVTGAPLGPSMTAHLGAVPSGNPPPLPSRAHAGTSQQMPRVSPPTAPPPSAAPPMPPLPPVPQVMSQPPQVSQPPQMSQPPPQPPQRPKPSHAPTYSSGLELELATEPAPSSAKKADPSTDLEFDL